MSREEDVEPDDVSPAVGTTEFSVRSLDTAARGLPSVATELAGPKSVSVGGGLGISGSVSPLTVGTTLRGSSGHLDPSVDGISLMQSRVLSDSGDSGPGLVGVGVPAAAAVATAAAAVGDVVEREESTRNTVERVDSSSKHTHIAHEQPNRTYSTHTKSQISH